MVTMEHTAFLHVWMDFGVSCLQIVLFSYCSSLRSELFNLPQVHVLVTMILGATLPSSVKLKQSYMYDIIISPLLQYHPGDLKQ